MAQNPNNSVAKPPKVILVEDSLKTIQKSQEQELEIRMLKEKIEIYSSAYERQWSHFALITAITFSIIGVLLPLLGYFSWKKQQKEVEAGIAKIETFKQEIESRLMLELQTSRSEIRETSHKSMLMMSENFLYIADLYRLKKSLNVRFKIINNLRRIRMYVESLNILAKVVLAEQDASYMGEVNARIDAIQDVYNQVADHIESAKNLNHVIDLGPLDELLNTWLSRYDFKYVFELISLADKNDLDTTFLISFKKLLQKTDLF